MAYNDAKVTITMAVNMALSIGYPPTQEDNLPADYRLSIRELSEGF